MSLDLFCFCIANIVITYCKRLSSWHLQRCDFQETQKLYHLCPQGNVDASYWTSLSLITSSHWLWINVLNTSLLSALIWLDMAWQGKNSNYCNFEALDEALMPVALGSSFCETQMLLSETSSVSSWFSYVFLPTSSSCADSSVHSRLWRLWILMRSGTNVCEELEQLAD